MLSLKIDPLTYVWNLPEFNGDYRDLQVFIDLVDGIQPLIAKYDSFSQTIIFDNIKAKLKGHAREIVEINAPATDWLQIRKILISNFGVKGTAEELSDELGSTKFKTNSAEFYNDVITALHKLNLKTKQTTDPSSASSSIENNRKAALAVFKNRMAEPMRSLLYCRNPTTLEEANNILHECGYAYYCLANINSYQNPFQQRQSLFPFQHKQSNCGPFGMNATSQMSQNNSNIGLFGGKVTQSTSKQPSTAEPMDFGVVQGLASQRRDRETHSTDQPFPFKSCTQSGQNV